MIGGLLQYAEEQIELNTPDKSGYTKRQHLESAARQGAEPEELFAPCECPSELFYLWEHFAYLSAKRTTDGKGNPQPITYQNIWYYCWAHHLPPFAAWEMGAIGDIDGIWFKVRKENQPQQISNEGIDDGR